MINFFRRNFFSLSKSSSSSHTRGFTLIELSIVMAIIGVMVAGALGAYKVVIVKEYRDVTQERLKDIRQAMVRFQSKNTNARLPAPASLYLPPTDPNFGAEDNPTTTCATASPVLSGTVCAPAAPGGTVRIGMVPVKTLGLSAEMANDSWGRRFIYAVSENLADSVTVTPYSATNGKITLLDNSGSAMGNNIPFTIVSTGKSGYGGITAAGKNFPTPCPAIGTPEGDNCDLSAPDTTFGDRTYSEAGAAAVHFDDYVVHTLDNISGGGGGGAKNIDDLTDGISDWPGQPTPTNVFLGNGAGGIDTGLGTINTGVQNTAAGIDALNALTTGYWDTALGYWALKSNTTGSDNTAIGPLSLTVNVDGKDNTATGLAALTRNIGGSYNTATGTNALGNNIGTFDSGNPYNSTASWNTAMGAFALQSNLDGSYNTAVGSWALWQNNHAYNNTALGAYALYWDREKSENTAVGYSAMYYADNTTGLVVTANTAVGAYALRGSTTAASNTGINNTAVGHSALMSNTSGSYNTANGRYALYSNNAGTHNTALGSDTLYFNTYGSYNTATGVTALSLNTQGNANTATGYGALYSNTIGSNNTAVGEGALDFNVAKNENTAVGFYAMFYANSLTTSAVTYNTAVGAYALQGGSAYTTAYGDLNTGTSNTAVGHSALLNNAGGSFNTATGHQSLYYNTSGIGNTAVGSASLDGNISGSRNTALGKEAIFTAGDTQGANDNTAVGYQALYSVSNGINTSRNTAVGGYALSNTIGTDNVALGYQAGKGNGGGGLGGKINTFIGVRTGYNGTLNSYTNSTAIGAGAQITQNDMVQIGNASTIAADGSLSPSMPVIPFVRRVNLGDPSASSTTQVYSGAFYGQTVVLSSDLRLKKDIADSDLGLDFLEKLRPVSYRMKEGSDALRYGFIAQEVEKTLGDRVTGMVLHQADKMKTYGLSYTDFIAPIVKAIQEIVAMFNGHDKLIHEQQAQIEALTKSVAELKAEVNALQKGK